MTDEIETLAKSYDGCRRVMTVPGIGPIISSATATYLEQRPRRLSASTSSRGICEPARRADQPAIPGRDVWDRQDKGVRWTVAASTNVAIGHPALDTAIAAYPSERFTLRNGIHVIRQYGPEKAASHPR